MRVSVKEILGVGGPKDLGELQKDLGVGANGELVDGFMLPVRELGREGHCIVLQNAQ